MARFAKALGRNKDYPLIFKYDGAAASGGTSSDFEFPIITIPDLTYNAATGASGDIPSNTIAVRWCFLTFISAITGSNTHNCTFNFRQYRSGSLLATTTASTAVSAAGSATITPASMAGIFTGQTLYISGGTGTAENVIVTGITSTTFTTVFANTHSGTYNIVQAPLATITFASGTNASAFTPIQFARVPNTVQRGDVITIQRVSSDSTGLANPAFQAGFDWSSSGAG